MYVVKDFHHLLPVMLPLDSQYYKLLTPAQLSYNVTSAVFLIWARCTLHDLVNLKPSRNCRTTKWGRMLLFLNQKCTQFIFKYFFHIYDDQYVNGYFCMCFEQLNENEDLISGALTISVWIRKVWSYPFFQISRHEGRLSMNLTIITSQDHDQECMGLYCCVLYLQYLLKVGTMCVSRVKY
jgi:hypothetical protein